MCINIHYGLYIGIAESWCNSEVGDAELHLQGYNLLRDDRQSGVGGGVMLYIHEELPAVPCKGLNDVGFDNSLWYTISLTNNDMLLVGVLYRAPSSSIENNQKLLSIISNLYETSFFSHFSHFSQQW